MTLHLNGFVIAYASLWHRLTDVKHSQQLSCSACQLLGLLLQVAMCSASCTCTTLLAGCGWQGASALARRALYRLSSPECDRAICCLYKIGACSVFFSLSLAAMGYPLLLAALALIGLTGLTGYANCATVGLLGMKSTWCLSACLLSLCNSGFAELFTDSTSTI